MKSWANLCGRAVWWCAHCVLSLFLWTLWLGLCLLLALEIWIATSRELAVPGFVLRELEQRLEVSHVQVKFGRTHFDPSGRILVEDLRVFLPAFAEPVLHCQSAQVELNPWVLLTGRFEPHVLHVSGGNFAIPAMLSTTGQAEDIVQDLDATVRLGDNQLLIEDLTARVAGFAVKAHGGLHLIQAPAGKVQATPLPIADSLSGHFPEICRQLVRASERLAALDEPQLELALTPSDTRVALVDATVLAAGLKLDTPVVLQARGLRLTTRFPLQGRDPVIAPLALTVDELTLPGGVIVSAVSARLRGSFRPDVYTYDPRDVLLTASRLEVHGFTFNNLITRLKPGPLPQLSGDVAAECAGLPLVVRGAVNFAQAAATVHVDGALAPALLVPIGAVIGHDIRPFFGLAAPLVLSADATFAPGWKFSGVTGRFRTGAIDAFHVPIDAGHAEFEFDGRYFTARNAYAKLGENSARGSFFDDFATGEHRFLLQGRLRPLAIAPWFGKWWAPFFKDYEFPVMPPDASVDVKGNWHGGGRNTVFVYVDSTAPVVHGVKFDHARTLMFIRPNFMDGLEVFATIGSGAARGTFMRQVDANFDLLGLDFNFDTTLGLDVPSQIFGPVVADVLAPYRFENAPTVKVQMHFDGAASPDGAHQLASITASSAGAFFFHDFPLSNLSFHAKVHDDEVVLDHFEVGFAGGTSSGSARVWGVDQDRRLGFDYVLRNASLGSAVSTVQTYSARQAGRPPAPPDEFIQSRANVKLDLAVSAEGLYDDAYSYKGSGNASLAGDALGQVKMLGLLSDLFSFTSLRFTSARASFKVDGPKLVFPQISMTGANSAIEARGSYALDTHQLDFTARVSPFQESTFIPSVLLGAMLSPLSSALEVRLTGQIDKPAWAFVNGPTNFLRNLTKPSAAPASVTAPAAPKN
jgi:hypothetical protein